MLPRIGLADRIYFVSPRPDPSQTAVASSDTIERRKKEIQAHEATGEDRSFLKTNERMGMEFDLSLSSGDLRFPRLIPLLFRTSSESSRYAHIGFFCEFVCHFSAAVGGGGEREGRTRNLGPSLQPSLRGRTSWRRMG